MTSLILIKRIDISSKNHLILIIKPHFYSPLRLFIIKIRVLTLSSTSQNPTKPHKTPLNQKYHHNLYYWSQIINLTPPIKSHPSFKPPRHPSNLKKRRRTPSFFTFLIFQFTRPNPTPLKYTIPTQHVNIDFATPKRVRTPTPPTHITLISSINKNTPYYLLCNL